MSIGVSGITFFYFDLRSEVEGMEVSSSDSDSESPSTSASCQSKEERLHSSESDSDEQAQCSSSTLLTTQSPEPSNHINPDEEATGHEQFVSDSGQTEVVDEATDKGKPVSDPGQIELSEEPMDEGQSVSSSGQAEPSEAIPESEKPTVTPDPPKELSSMVSKPLLVLEVLLQHCWLITVVKYESLPSKSIKCLKFYFKVNLPPV